MWHKLFSHRLLIQVKSHFDEKKEMETTRRKIGLSLMCWCRIVLHIYLLTMKIDKCKENSVFKVFFSILSRLTLLPWDFQLILLIFFCLDALFTCLLYYIQRYCYATLQISFTHTLNFFLSFLCTEKLLFNMLLIKNFQRFNISVIFH